MGSNNFKIYHLYKLLNSGTHIFESFGKGGFRQILTVNVGDVGGQIIESVFGQDGGNQQLVSKMLIRIKILDFQSLFETFNILFNYEKLFEF